MLLDIFGYVNDSFSWEFANQKTWYEPYHKFLPLKQTALLTLFDELGVPHEEEKQLHSYILMIIGFDVDPNAMTITMPIPSRIDLIHTIRNFALVGICQPLRNFNSLAGWCNWSFNVYLLLCPGLSTLYAKKQGKSHLFQLIWISKALCHELLWMADHLEDMPGILFLESLEWGVHLADITIQTDASSKGFSIWFLNLVTGFFSHFVNDADDGIFFNEALTVVSALLLALQFSSKLWWILIYTDNMNTLCVLHIPSPSNIIADTLSCGNNDLVLMHYPNAHLVEFTPPQLKSGSANLAMA
ncbi:hypothetical protein ARMSODRAFT_990949 [Armillaria solidipes]|uniref:Uncharacterized protein n=1 Tax=Armillaria solidipes TaxID=1076256 RepID=A0A2H3BBE8_9AGAR|nr:hypothetical protein ARMSODRAFT_990949 [Armillaria solidipes]